MHNTVKTALLALCLVAAVAAADNAVPEKATASEQEPEEYTFTEDHLIDVLPSEIDRDPNPHPEHRVNTGDEAYDEAADIAAVQIADSSESQLAYWRDPAGKRMCDAYAVGDPHFRSFDGQVFHFQGVGQFELVNCNNFQVQARNSVCGRHGYYGQVACWNSVAIKYTDSKGNTDVVEVTTRSGYEYGRRGVKINNGLPIGYIKINGSPAKSQTAAVKLKNGCDVVPVVVHGRKRVYVYCPDNNQAMTTNYALYVRRPCGQKCAPALLGNDDGVYANDYIGLTGKNYDKSINNPNSHVDRSNKVDDDIKKPLHKWGMEYMVDDKKIKSFFGDKAKAYDFPEIKPAKTKFSSPAMKKKAHDFCYGEGCSYDFYQDCMMDAAATDSLDISREDKKANDIFNRMENGDNAHNGKVAIAKILGKMEMDMGIQRDNIGDAMAKEAENVKALALKVGQNEKQEKADCPPVVPKTHKYNAEARQADLEHGAKKQHCKEADEQQKNMQEAVKQIVTEDALVREMMNTLKNLVNVNELQTVNDLVTEPESLIKAPALRNAVQELIEEERAHKWNSKSQNGETSTARINTLLEELLHQMRLEKKNLEGPCGCTLGGFSKGNPVWKNCPNQESEPKVGLANCAKTVCDAAKKRADDQDEVKDTAAADLGDQKKKCEEAKNNKNGGNEVYRQAQNDQAKNNAERGKELKELRDEVEMIHNLQDVMKNWSKNKGPQKKCPTQTDLLEESHDQSVYDEIDASMPVESADEARVGEERRDAAENGDVSVDDLQED